MTLPLAWGMNAAEYHVSPGGDDDGPGTLEQPFRTIEKARDTLRESDPTPGAERVVYLRDGFHMIHQTLVFDERDGGLPGAETIYQAYPGERPVLTGRREVAGWEPLESAPEIYWAPLAADLLSREFYVNGLRAVRARSPGGLQGGITLTEDGLLTDDSSLLEWKQPERVEWVLKRQWRNPRILVRDISTEIGRVRVRFPTNAWRIVKGHFEADGARTVWYFENAFELLDEPGEWFMDEAAARIFYWPRPGEDLGTAVTTFSVTEKLLEIKGSSVATPVEHLRFEGLEFADATWLRPSRSSHPSVQANLIREWLPVDFLEKGEGPHALLAGAAIELGFARAIDFRRCRWTRLGGAGINLYQGSQTILITGCSFVDLSGSAIQIGEPAERDRNNVHPEDPRYLVRNITLENNWIHRIGIEYRSSIAIFAAFAQELRIAHNHIEGIPQSAISIGWGWAWEIFNANRGHQVEKNAIYNILDSDLYDGGALYALGPQPGSVYRHNYVRGQIQNYAPIYPDNGASGILYEGNVTRDVPRWIHLHSQSTVSNVIQGNYSTTRRAFINNNDNLLVDNKFIEDGVWPIEALHIIEASGIQPAFSDILPRGVELLNPMHRAHIETGGKVILTAKVFGDSASIQHVEFHVGGSLLAVDVDGADGWRALWIADTPGSFNVQARAVWQDGGAVTSEAARIDVDIGAPDLVAVQDEPAWGGFVIEAENFQQSWSEPTLPQEWLLATELQGYTGPGAMRVVPENGLFLGLIWLDYSPRLDYRVEFTQAGNYFVSLRAQPALRGALSCHIGLDGIPIAQLVGAANQDSDPNGWTWMDRTLDGTAARVVVEQPGWHTFHIWMAADGVALDRVILALDAASIHASRERQASPLDALPPQPVVTLQVTDAQGKEFPTEPAAVTLYREESADQPLPVTIELRGTATPGLDYIAPTNPAVIPGGSSEVEIQIAPKLDDINEPLETVAVRILPGPGYSVGFPAQAEVSIRDASVSETGLWRQEHFGDFFSENAADWDDPDGDGLPNLIEEAFDMDPLNGLSETDALKLPRAWLGRFDGKDCLYLRYYRPHSGENYSSMNYAVESCQNLQLDCWRSVEPDWIGMDLAGYLGGLFPGRFIRMRFPIEPESGAQFFRLTVQRNNRASK